MPIRKIENDFTDAVLKISAVMNIFGDKWEFDTNLLVDWVKSKI